jgi:hypothetical protein
VARVENNVDSPLVDATPIVQEMTDSSDGLPNGRRVRVSVGMEPPGFIRDSRFDRRIQISQHRLTHDWRFNESRQDLLANRNGDWRYPRRSRYRSLGRYMQRAMLEGWNRQTGQLAQNGNPLGRLLHDLARYDRNQFGSHRHRHGVVGVTYHGPELKLQR